MDYYVQNSYQFIKELGMNRDFYNSYFKDYKELLDSFMFGNLCLNSKKIKECVDDEVLTKGLETTAFFVTETSKNIEAVFSKDDDIKEILNSDKFRKLGKSQK